MLSAAAAFVLQTAAAGAWIVAADLGMFADVLANLGRTAVVEVPSAVDLVKVSQFMVPLADLFFRVVGDEFDPSFRVCRAAAFNLDRADGSFRQGPKRPVKTAGLRVVWVVVVDDAHLRHAVEVLQDRE
jgi:hypothetical protein